MLYFLQNLFFYVVPFALVLSLIVTVHELGHFLVAKWCGVAIERFAIGFGRPIFSHRDQAGVEWRIGWIPLGGYVLFSGDTNASSVPDHDDMKVMRDDIIQREGKESLSRYFHFKPVWQRALVTLAGPVANFLLAIVLFAILFLTFGEQVVPPRVAVISPASPASEAGFKVNDEIVRINGRRITNFRSIGEVIQVRTGVATRFDILRDGKPVTLSATPRKVIVNTISGPRPVSQIGIAPPPDVTLERSSLPQALSKGVVKTWDTLTGTLYVLGRIVQGGISLNQLHGPIGIAHLSGDIAKASGEGSPNLLTSLFYGTANFLGLAAALSVGIGFMNLLPIPVLDGGHLLFFAYEALARRPLAAKVQALGYRVGLALVFGLMLFATWNDVHELQVFNFLGGLFS